MKKLLTLVAALATVGTGISLAPSAYASTNVVPAPWQVRYHLTQKYGSVALYGAVISTVNGSTLMVTLNGQTYTVNTTSTTTFVRRYMGPSYISQLTAGDRVNVRGTWDTTGTQVNATYVRDVSIQEYNDTFWGTVNSVNPSTNSFVFMSHDRGQLTVFVGTTKILDKNGNPIVITQMNVGDSVKVDAMWDRQNPTLTFVNRVQDTSLPQ